MRENCTYSLSGGRWPARKRATSDPTAPATESRPERLEWSVGIESHGGKAAEKPGTTGLLVRRGEGSFAERNGELSARLRDSPRYEVVALGHAPRKSRNP